MPKIVRNCLPVAKKLKVIDWLRANEAKLMEQRPSYVALSKELSAILEVPLSADVLERLLHMIGILWRPATEGGGGKWHKLNELIEELVKRMEDLEEAFRDRCEINKRRDSLMEQLQNRIAKLEIDLGAVSPPAVLPAKR